MRTSETPSSGTRATDADRPEIPPGRSPRVHRHLLRAWFPAVAFALGARREDPSSPILHHRGRHRASSEGGAADARSGSVTYHCPSCSRTFADFPDWDAHVRLTHLA